MKDFCFIAGVGVGALVGMIVMYKSKMAKEIAEKCEEGITDTAQEIKKKIAPKPAKKSAQAKEKK